MLQRNLTVGDSLQDTREHSLFGVLEAGATAKNVTCSLGSSWVGVHTAAEALLARRMAIPAEITTCWESPVCIGRLRLEA